MSEAKCGLGMLSECYVEMQMSLGLARIDLRGMKERILVLEHDNQVLEADRDHYATGYAAQRKRVDETQADRDHWHNEALRRDDLRQAAERKLEELRSYLHQFASTHDATREVARAWLLAEARAYHRLLTAQSPSAG